MKTATLLIALCLFSLSQASLWDTCEHDDGRSKMIGMTAGHNVRRCRHGANPLEWDTALSKAAQKHAQKCKWEHSTSTSREKIYTKNGGASGWIGENIAMGSGSNYTPEQALTQWYDNELPYYNFATGKTTDSSQQTGHMTQIAWKDTKKIGCGIADCPGFGMFYVCNFFPGGNFNNAYTQQVAPLQNNDFQCKYEAAAKKSTYKGVFNKNSQCASSNIGQGSFYKFNICGDNTFCCPSYPCEAASYSWSYSGECTVSGTCMNCGGGSKWWETVSSCAGGTTINNGAGMNDQDAVGLGSSGSTIMATYVLGLVMAIFSFTQ